MRTNPKLWKSIVSKVKKGSKGGNPGQWSARKAQLAVKMYKKSGSYNSPKKNNNSLVKWTKQRWRTRSGRPSLKTGERYLPEKVIKRLTKKEYSRTSRNKRMSMKKGVQYSRQPNDIIRKIRRLSKLN